MKKSNVFLMSGRTKNTAGEACGNVVQRLICSNNEQSAREYLGRIAPSFVVVGCIGLADLEIQVQKIKDVLAQSDTSWEVAVDPRLGG
jgi:hypothetical protein